MANEFLSVSQAADRLGVSEDHVRRHAPIVKLGRRTLVPESWLDDLAQPAQPGPPSAQPENRSTPKPAGRVWRY